MRIGRINICVRHFTKIGNDVLRVTQIDIAYSNIEIEYKNIVESVGSSNVNKFNDETTH